MVQPKVERHARHWTEKEDKKLTALWGSADLKRLAEVFGRTPVAITGRVSRLGLGSPSRDTRSMNALSKETGYHVSQLFAAVERLGIKLERVRRMRIQQRRFTVVYAVTEEQEEAILGFLKSHPGGKRLARIQGRTRTVAGMWGVGVKPSACVDCGTTTKPHRARGRCKKCYLRFGAQERKKRRHAGGNRADESGVRRAGGVQRLLAAHGHEHRQEVEAERGRVRTA